ncbi:MAG: hypothetical protein GEV06_16570 [Luteitalea sp.]|nr:hypothetical protein [Luteitalea sp.]
MPADVQTCFSQYVKAPKGPLSKRAVVRLIAELKRSEVAKSRCGRRLIGFYNSIAKGLAQ